MANNRAPARAGDTLESIDTPALLLQIEPFQSSLAAMARTVAAAGKALRPHGKAHKCVEIARRQIAAGAVGICCQKVAEAEVFVEAGIGDVLVTNQVVGERKVDRLAALATRARIGVCVDHPLQVEQLAAAARRRNVSIDVLIEIDVGARRCGVTSIDESLTLAARVAAAAPALRLRGLQAYNGRAQHLRGVDERRAAIAATAELAARHRAALRAAGHPCDWVTGAGTGTFTSELACDVYTEVQPGSYVLMDADYHANAADPLAPAFGQALTVLATVISVHTTHVVLDAGLKALSAECGLPQSTEAGWKTCGISDEHVVMRPDGEGGRSLSLGDRFRLMPSHCDPTVNLHDWIVVMRDDTVDAVWPVDARGAMF